MSHMSPPTTPTTIASVSHIDLASAITIAIYASQDENRIVHIPAATVGAEGAELLEDLCSGSVPEAGDYWGDDEDGEWRIIIDV